MEYSLATDADLIWLQASDHAEWQQEFWVAVSGLRSVRGTNVEFTANANGSPRTRYEALFDMLRTEYEDFRSRLL